MLNDLHSYDIKSKTFSKIQSSGSPPSPRSGCKICRILQNIYFFGGYMSKENEYFNDFYKYDIVANKFEKMILSGDSIEGLVDHIMVPFNKYLYVYGGKTQKYLSKFLYRINVEKSTIKNLKYSGDIPTPRFGHTANVYKNSFFMFGGWNGYETVDELFYFSMISNIWYEVRLVCGTKPNGRYRHSSVIFGQSLFIFGGVDQKQKKYNDLYEFLIEKNEWRLIETKGLSMPSPRSFHQMENYENRVFIFGGNDEKKLNDLFFMIIRKFFFEIMYNLIY